MAIRNDSEAKPGDDVSELQFIVEPWGDWRGGCVYCQNDIAIDEKYWIWSFGPRGSIRMHLECFKTWEARIEKAARELETLND